MALAATTLASESRDFVDHYWEHGYAIIRGFLSKPMMAQVQAEAAKVYAEGMKHPRTWRDHNVLYEILPEEYAGKRYLMQAHWFSWYNSFFEQLRRSPEFKRVLEPLLGRNVRQIAQQIHWKPPGAPDSGYRMHQDLRFRERLEDFDFNDIMASSVTLGLAIDPATKENGCLRIVPDSHRKGYLGLADDGPIMKGATNEDEMAKAGLDPAQAMDCILEPGDLLIWGLLTVHGSQKNSSDKDRAFLIQSYYRAANSERGEWVFKDGVSTPLGPEPLVCKYVALKEKPGPFYSEDKWYEKQRA
jgi:ectoine hydroxylase-related dioxygenase (phytanoyl-CoA dioxygenase family)